MINGRLKTALTIVGKAAFALRLDGLFRWAGRNHPKILLLHAVEPTETAFFRGLTVNTTPERFAENLDWLAEHYNVISLEDLERGDIPPRAVMITFDDGYRSLLTHALPLLEERAMPATIYLVTGSVDNRRLVWVNELSWLLQHHRGPASRQFSKVTGLSHDASPGQFMVTLQTRFDPQVAKQLIDDIWQEVPDAHNELTREPAVYLSWDEIRHMAERGVSFGCHTVTHPSLPGVSDAQAECEIVAARDEIAAQIGSCTSFAYPFGHRDERTEAIAKGVGFTSIMQVSGSNVPLDLQPCARVSIADASNAEMFARMEVVIPGIARIRRIGERLTSIRRR